jgi:cytochrome c-type biogenesis protein CcmE
LPDNLANGIAVLVEGRLDDAGLLHGEKVLTRCTSKYQSRQSTSTAAE